MNILDAITGMTGQQRTAALRDLGRRAEYYVPPELRGILGFAAEMTPSETLSRAGAAGREMTAPGRTPMQRLGSAGEMLSETAAVAAPAAAAGRAAMPAAQAVQEAFMGFSVPARAAGEGLLARVNQTGPVPTMYSNPLRVFHGGKDLVTDPRATVDPEGLLPGFSVTPDKEVAGMYAKMRGGDAVSAFDIDESKLNPIGEMELYKIQNFLEMSKGLDEGDLPEAELLKELKGRGINAVKYDDPEFGIRVLDTSILKPSAVSLPTPRNEAEAMAKQVLEMRAAGRAGDVTEEMRAAADPQYMFANTPLPMDEASRMARAREAGLDVDTPLYHGTPGADIQAFRPSRSGAAGPGVYTSQMPSTASGYAEGMGLFDRRNAFSDDTGTWIEGGNVLDVIGPRNLQSSEDWTANMMSEMSGSPISRQQAAARATQQAISQGFQGAQARSPISSMGRNVVIFDPTNIRSRFALFDPEFAHLRNLSAGVGGLGLLSLMQQPQEPQ